MDKTNTKNNIFLNIIILFSPNYDNKKNFGTVKKNIFLMDQFLLFYRSIKNNLISIPFDISIVHFNKFNKTDTIILNNLDVNLFFIDTNDIRVCAINRYVIQTRIKGTHRLIAETDMLMLKQPKFNWDVDFQAMYAGSTYSILQINNNKIFSKFNIKKKYIYKSRKIEKLFRYYNIDNLNHKILYPFFNNGLLLMKEEFSKKFFEKIVNENVFNILDNCFSIKYKHFGPQIIFSLFLVSLTDNWLPFEPGINYLLKAYDVNKFGKNNISLLHYCGIGADKVAIKEFPEYLIINKSKLYDELNIPIDIKLKEDKTDDENGIIIQTNDEIIKLEEEDKTDDENGIIIQTNDEIFKLEEEEKTDDENGIIIQTNDEIFKLEEEEKTDNPNLIS